MIDGYLYKGVVENRKIVSINKFKTNDFPHGIDVRDNKIAYTSYSTSGIHIITDIELVNPIVVYDNQE